MVMSGPISSLKKNKRPPFRVPHEVLSTPVSPRNIALSPIDTADEELNSLADDVTSMMASQKMKETRKMLPPLSRNSDRANTTLDSLSTSGGASSSRASNMGGNQASDFELMSIMMSKITQLERRLHEQSVELNERNQRIQLLEEKVRLFQRSRSPDSDGRKRVSDLEKRCLLFQQQIYEMENFLADYGLIWVGESDGTYEEIADDGREEDNEAVLSRERSFLNQPPDKTWQPKSSVAPEFKMNFDRVIAQVRELNLLAGADEAKIEHTGSGMARLQRPKAVPLTLFANGIVMFEGPFRPYTCITTQNCLTDIMDGFFPSELESRFPDGVPIDVNDKRNVYFKEPSARMAFKGPGQKLGGTRSTSVLVERSETPLSKDDATQPDPAVQHEYSETTSELPGPRLTVDQFLGHLPASVVRDGKVIDIRNSVRKTMLGRDPDNSDAVQCSIVETASVRELQERVESGRREVRTVSGARVATVRVKSEDGRHTFVMRMKFEEKVSDLKAYLDAKRPPALKGSYDLLGDFPRRVLSDDAKTLEECGLVPNATVYLRKRSG